MYPGLLLGRYCEQAKPGIVSWVSNEVFGKEETMWEGS